MADRGLRADAWLVVAGAAVVVLTAVVGSGFNPLSIPFAAWGALPWVILWYLGRMMPAWVSGGAAAAALAAELGIRAAVFVWPRSSTAAIALLFSPVFIAAIVMPAGAAAGWLCGWPWGRHAAARVAVILVVLVLLGLLALGLARPELFPATLMNRHAALDRIGPPQIVAGGDRFESVRVTSQAAWFQVADLDGQHGEELALVVPRAPRSSMRPLLNR